MTVKKQVCNRQFAPKCDVPVYVKYFKRKRFTSNYFKQKSFCKKQQAIETFSNSRNTQETKNKKDQFKQFIFQKYLQRCIIEKNQSRKWKL